MQLKRERLRDIFFKCSVHFCDTTDIYHNVRKTVCQSEAFGRIEKMSKINFIVVTPTQICWTVVDSTKSVSAELSDFGL
jgi:hypothetical protein